MLVLVVGWRCKLLDGWSKPKPEDPRAAKEQFIRAKYQWKGFVDLEPTDDCSPDMESRRLIEAAQDDNLVAMLRAMVRGANLNYEDKNQRGALHVSEGHRKLYHFGGVDLLCINHRHVPINQVAANAGHIECCAFLVQNGADTQARDAQGEWIPPPCW